ncbi:MAG: FAD-dependent oxidoreductase [Geminicoccaceae bacterium]
MRVVIVGAGVAGLSAAWWLRRLGHQPVVIDQGPIPNPMASSFDRHRLIRLAHSEGDGRGVIIHEAFAAWDALWADLGTRHYAETGMLMVGSRPDDWAHSCRAAFDRNAVAYEVWDRAELGRRCGYLALGDDDWGLFTARGGALFADRILIGLASWLLDAGADLYPRAEVVAVDREAATATLADGTVIGGDALIVAAGAWTGRLLPELAPSLQPRRSVVAYLKPPADLAPLWQDSPCFLDFGRGSDMYAVPPLEGMDFKFGSGDHSRPGDPATPRALAPDEPESLLAFMRPFLRDFDRYQVSDVRVCYTCYSPDQHFIAGRDGRMAYVSGCSGQMFKFGAVMGRRLAEAAIGTLDGETLRLWARGERPLGG